MTRHVSFGLWYDFRNPKPWRTSFERLYEKTLDQIVWAEELGFDSIWLTEHHFCEDGYTPSPLVIAGAIGARTKRVQIGTNLLLLPLYDPIRMAEDCATVSLLSSGRFNLGVGGGYVEKEFEVFGRQVKHRPSLLEEAIEILRAGWSGDTITFSGKRYNYTDVRVFPVPETPPKIFLGAISEPAADRAARIADGFLSSGYVAQDLYVNGIRKIGKNEKDAKIYAGCWGIVTEDPEAELERIGEHLRYQMNQYILMGAFGGPEQTPLFETPEAAVENGFYEFWTPDEAVQKLITLVTDWPQIKDVHFWAQFPGEPIESGSRRIEALAKQVLPKVREAVNR